MCFLYNSMMKLTKIFRSLFLPIYHTDEQVGFSAKNRLNLDFKFHIAIEDV